jgi:Site-specific DNA methylase
MKFYSPLRYPGGKGKTSNFFSYLLDYNNLKGGVYVEPYVGGGSVALYLLFNEIVNKIVINDKDKSIYAFWYSVIHNTDSLCKMIKDTPIDVNCWKEQQEIQKHKDDVDLLTLGFSTFFLNRTNRSGIIKGGIIGGYEQKGTYKIDARFNKENLISRIRKISEYAKDIDLYNIDAADLISEQKNILPDNTLFYFDPPYYVKGKGLYMNFYNEQDHENLYKAISQIENQKWVVTYDYVPFISNLYNKYRIEEYYLNYCAQTVGKGKEYMIFSDNINIPKHELLMTESTSH